MEIGWLHVMNRGLDRLDIYREDGDREHILELLGEMSERYGVQVHGYVLMSNHYHLWSFRLESEDPQHIVVAA